MYKVYKSQGKSIVADETRKIYCIVSNEEADVLVKGIKNILVFRETLYTSLDFLNSSGYKKVQFLTTESKREEEE